MMKAEPIEESIFPEKQVVYATFMARFWAAVVDGVFVMLAWFIVVQFLGGSALGGFINILIVVLYYPLMEASARQATLGKNGMNIKVTDREGNRITMGQAFGRHFARLLSIALLFMGYFRMLWDSKKQTLHDKAAGTLVISVA